MAAILIAPTALAQPAAGGSCGDVRFPESACAPIHPGASLLVPGDRCTVGFIVTDGLDLFLSTAGHCLREGQRVGVTGRPEVGTAALRGAHGDWGFVRVDPEDRSFVDPAFPRWSGPRGVEPPRAGDVILYEGRGDSSPSGAEGRVGVVVRADPGARTFWFLGSADHGDSGAPVLRWTGEAAGIVVATLVPGPAPSVVVAVHLDEAMEELADALGRPVALVEGPPPLVALCGQGSGADRWMSPMSDLGDPASRGAITTAEGGAGPQPRSPFSTVLSGGSRRHPPRGSRYTRRPRLRCSSSMAAPQEG